MKRNEHILVVDDDRLIRATLVQGLRSAGFEVSEAGSGEGALAWVTEHQADLALLDMRMSGISGLEVAQHFREKGGPPFMFLSAYGDDATVLAAAEAGALGYLVKPMDVAQVIPAIESALARAAELSKLHKSERQLETALAQNREVSVAVGIIMERFRLNRDAAFDLLRDRARAERRKLLDLADEMVRAAESMSHSPSRDPKRNT